MAKSSSSGSKRQKLDPLSKCGMQFSDDYEDDGIELEDEEPEQDDYSYRVLSSKEIVEHMNECIREVNTVLQLPATTVRILLNHFRWDKDKLLEAYYESDQEQLFRDARIINPNDDNATVTASDGIAEECEICCASKSIDMMNEMQCGHRFCTECWNTYLTTKISDEGMGQTIACAAHDCPILVDDASVMKLLTDEKVKLRYQHLITNSFVQCHKRMKWCPAAGCSNAIRVQYSDCKPVHCTCGFEFCFQCGNLWHDPVKCLWLKKWLKNVDDDVQSSKWISANTKECPKCSASIQKNGGCNHMVCKNQNCNAQFCWVCLRLWEAHGRQGGYNCNRYEDSGDKLEKSKRYFFYCNRYMNHMQSLKFENQLYESMKAKMEEMQQHGMRWIDVQFLNKSVDILCKCRQTLAYTYAFAFYLDKTNQSLIFESNQLDLESATEELSEYLERKVSAESVSDIKQKVQDKYGYCETRRKILLQHVHEGYEKDWWKFNDGN